MITCEKDGGRFVCVFLKCCYRVFCIIYIYTYIYIICLNYIKPEVIELECMICMNRC